jgi:hypothetical protein
MEIQLAVSPMYERCGDTKTIQHRLISCAPGPVLWLWPKGVIAAILRVSNGTIPDAWTWCPMYAIWPQQRRSAVTWIIAQFVSYRLRMQHTQSLNPLAPEFTFKF